MKLLFILFDQREILLPKNENIYTKLLENFSASEKVFVSRSFSLSWPLGTFYILLFSHYLTKKLKQFDCGPNSRIFEVSNKTHNVVLCVHVFVSVSQY